jgi:hypothetical protein
MCRLAPMDWIFPLLPLHTKLGRNKGSNGGKLPTFGHDAANWLGFAFGEGGIHSTIGGIHLQMDFWMKNKEGRRFGGKEDFGIKLMSKN